ncbi:iron chelate uptake ABC transporter family permease subunit [Psychromonas sp. KJ10-2]
MLIADLIGRSVFAPTQLAAGSVTALIGAPLFAYLLITKKT